MNYFAPKSNRGYRFTAKVMFVVFVHSGSYENTCLGRQYGTGSVSDLNRGEDLFIESQVARAPRTVPIRWQTPIRRPFSRSGEPKVHRLLCGNR